MIEYEDYFPAPEYKVSWYFFQELYGCIMQHIKDDEYHYSYKLDKEKAKWFPNKKKIRYYEEQLKNNQIKCDFIMELAHKAKEEVKNELKGTKN